MAVMSKPVFISYSHDSEAHREWVLSLSERLRQDGIPTELDQYVQGTPAKGWPRWMLDQLDTAEFVLVICTETYYRRFHGHEEPSSGKGVDWEGALITQDIYDHRSDTRKFVPVLRAAEDNRFIPGPLRGHTHYLLTSEDAYGALKDFLLGQAGVEPGQVGVPDLRPRKRGVPLTLGSTSADAPSCRSIHLPYLSLGDLFKGRESVVAGLRASFANAGAEPGQIAVRVLHGLGGVGKTRAAVEYGWRYSADYSAVFFVDAEREESLGRNLAALAGPLVLNLPEQDTAEEAVREAAVLHWLQGHPTWLLILDNLDSRAAATAAEAVLARLRGGHVLLTGRIAEWSGGLEPVELPVLDLDTATDFLLARTDARRRKAADDASGARELAERLGRLALALEQAGAYIAHQRLTFATYLEAWDKRRAAVLDWSDPRLMHYPRSLAVTWRTSFEQLTEQGKRLLRRLAWLAAEPIPDSLLDVPVFGEEGFDAREALADLASYSLVTRAAGEPTFSVHRLVQEVTRLEVHEGAAPPGLTEALTWLSAAFVGDLEDVRNWPSLDPLAPHARGVAVLAAELGVRGPTTRLLAHVGSLLHTKARFGEAEPLMRSALAIDEQSFGPEHPRVAAHVNNLAQLLKATNQLSEAEFLMRRALAIDEQHFGLHHPEVAIDLNNLAALLIDNDRFAEAEPLIRRALAIDEHSFGPDHPNVALRLNNLALLLQETDRVAEAEPLMRRALAINEHSYNSDHPKVATVLNNLALLLQATNRPAEAEPLIRRALTIDERSLGPDHPNVAIRLNNLARLLHTTNRLAEAEPLIRRALAIDEHGLGPDHPNVAIRLNNLALLLKDTHRVAEAEPLVRRALSIHERNYGSEHREVVEDLRTLAIIVEMASGSRGAEELRARARAIEDALAARKLEGEKPT